MNGGHLYPTYDTGTGNGRGHSHMFVYDMSVYYSRSIKQTSRNESRFVIARTIVNGNAGHILVTTPWKVSGDNIIIMYRYSTIRGLFCWIINVIVTFGGGGSRSDAHALLYCDARHVKEVWGTYSYPYLSMKTQTCTSSVMI